MLPRVIALAPPKRLPQVPILGVPQGSTSLPRACLKQLRVWGTSALEICRCGNHCRPHLCNARPSGFTIKSNSHVPQPSAKTNSTSVQRGCIQQPRAVAHVRAVASSLARNLWITVRAYHTGVAQTLILAFRICEPPEAPHVYSARLPQAVARVGAHASVDV